MRRPQELARLWGLRDYNLTQSVYDTNPCLSSASSGTTTVGASLLNRTTTLVNAYVKLPEHADTAVTLWTAHAHVIDASDISPILAIVSPAKRCGKSTLLRSGAPRAESALMLERQPLVHLQER